MLQRLFDSPAQLAILLVIILLLFGASRLPNTARQLGRSMRIFKSEMKEMKTENPPTAKRDDEADDEVRPVDALEGRVVDDHIAAPAPARNVPADADRDR